MRRELPQVHVIAASHKVDQPDDGGEGERKQKDSAYSAGAWLQAEPDNEEEGRENDEVMRRIELEVGKLGK